MLKKLKKSDSEGFTIIEVVIVLAIAGLILLIIFLAVPALQRNSRNTNRKNDVAALLAGVTEYSSNNNGALPLNTLGNTNTNGTVTYARPLAGGADAQVRVGYYNGGMGAVQSDTFIAANATTVAAGVFIDAAHDYVEIIPRADCGAGNAAVAGSARSVVAIYETETGVNTYSQQCRSS